MKALLRRFHQDETGATLVLVALGMSLFMAITALVTDVGIVFLEKTKLANAIDAATLAGIQELPDNPTEAVNVVNQYAALNGVEPSSLVITIASDNKSLSVQGTNNVNLFFSRLVGFDTGQVTASAGAEIGAIKSITGAVPFAIKEQELIYGQEYTLKQGSSDNGWFQCLALGGRGASVYENNIKYGYSGTLSIGDIVEAEPGNKSGPTRDGVQYRINADSHYPKCTVSQFERSCPRVVTVVVVSGPDGGGRSDLEIMGFAAFLLSEAPPGNGHDSEVKGYFINSIGSGEIDSTATGFGLNGVKLNQ